jgi:hypothetical protein
MREESMFLADWDDIVALAMDLRGPPGKRMNCKHIYPVVENIAPRLGRPLTTEWRATVRQTLQSHCSKSLQYKGGLDLFVHHSHDVWSLKPFDISPVT